MTWESAMGYSLGISLGFLILLVFGCAGSPKITINKQVYIMNSPNAKTEYKTESTTSNVAEIVQDLKDLLKVTPR